METVGNCFLLSLPEVGDVCVTVSREPIWHDVSHKVNEQKTQKNKKTPNKQRKNKEKTNNKKEALFHRCAGFLFLLAYAVLFVVAPQYSALHIHLTSESFPVCSQEEIQIICRLHPV